MKNLLLIAVLTGMSAPAYAQSVGPLSVFVTSSGAAGGLTDPSKDNINTVKDLRNSLKGKKGIALTDDREKATIVLTVMGRDRAAYTASAFGAGRDVKLRVKFECKDVETEMSASALGGIATTGGAWKKAAGKIAKQVEDWVRANRSKLG